MPRKKDRAEKKPLTPEELQNFAKCALDPFHFSQFINVIHPKRGKVPFNLYPFQIALLWTFLSNRFTIVLKFRQAGVTELIAMYALWLCMYHPFKNVVIISIKDRVAKKVLRKIKFMYKNLPDHLKVSVVNGRGDDIGTSCVTPDTRLIGEYKNFPIGEITPCLKGIMDVTHLNLRILTHRGTFERVTKTINKGVLETWEIENERGQILKCTPAHRLYTVHGWRTVREIVDKNLSCIYWDTYYLDGIKAPVTDGPDDILIRPTKYPGYYVSNTGKVYSGKRGKFKLLRTRIAGHERVKLKGPNKFIGIHRLVWETFNGPIPKGYVVDHIDCDRLNNNLTNLQLITFSQNTKRAYQYNRTLVNNNYRLSSITLRKLGKLKDLRKSIPPGYGSGRVIADKLGLTTKQVSHYARGNAGANIYTSKIKVNRVFEDTIVDLEVENYHSYITESHYVNHNTEMEFANGSIISSIPTTEDAGRSEAVSLMVIDEAAIVRWAEKIWAAAFPTLSTGGAAIINSCVTGDTEIVGKHGNFRLDTICPPKFGEADISGLGLEVLSHKGKWQKVLRSVNKGELETWEIHNRFGDVLKCTPDHKLLTTKGWRTVRQILDKKLRVMRYDPGITEVKPPPITVPPTREEYRPIPGYPNYLISNLGKVYIIRNGQMTEKLPQTNKAGYDRISLWTKGSKWKPMVANLVAEAFIGEIPDGYLVDHINCDPKVNHANNLQIIPRAENTQRAVEYSRGMKLGCKIGKGFPDVQLVGMIREKYKKYPQGYGTYDRIIKECRDEIGTTISRAFISRIVNGRRTSTVQISQIKLIRKYRDTIYDIEVQEDHSYLTSHNYFNHNTAYGVGNFFHKLWVNACAGGNKFIPVRLRWQMHPERDLDWYHEQRDVLGPRRTAQEIDGDFLTSGNTVFDLVDIRAIEDDLPEHKVIDTALNGQLEIFCKPQKNKRYYLGADVATGRARDYSAFTIMDRQGEEQAVFKGKLSPRQFAKVIYRFGKMYNWAVAAPESNDIGLAVAEALQEMGYPKLYYSKAIMRKKGANKPKVEEIPGWYTTKKNRPVIIAELEEDVRNGTIIVKDRFFVQEAYTFIYDETNRPVAMNKKSTAGSGDDLMDDEVYTDDSIFGKAICNRIRKEKIYHSALPM